MNSTESSKTEPTLVTLNESNSVQILVQYVEVAQQKGAYLLQEAEVLKRSNDVLLNNVPDKDITDLLAKQLLIQGVQKGQRHGAYTLNDAALLNKVVQFIANTFPKEESQVETSQVETSQVETSQVETSQVETSQQVTQLSSRQSDDLSDLAEPIPLKPKEV